MVFERALPSRAAGNSSVVFDKNREKTLTKTKALRTQGPTTTQGNPDSAKMNIAEPHAKEVLEPYVPKAKRLFLIGTGPFLFWRLNSRCLGERREKRHVRDLGSDCSCAWSHCRQPGASEPLKLRAILAPRPCIRVTGQGSGWSKALPRPWRNTRAHRPSLGGGRVRGERPLPC